MQDIVIDQQEMRMEVGETVQLSASPIPDNADDLTVTWRSDNDSIASVSQTGVVTAIASGYANIIAMSVDEAIRDTCRVTVNAHAESLSLSSSSIILTEVGQTYQLEASVIPEDAVNKSVTWNTLNESVCHVTANGLVIAVDYGTAVVTATTVDGGHTAVCTVKVVHGVEGVELNTHELTVKAKDTVQLTAKVLPDNAYDKTLIWTSSNDSLATVDAEGNVKALAIGEVFINATSSVNDGAKDSCLVKVVKRIELTDSAIVWNDTAFVYTGLSPQPTWKSNQAECTVTAEIPELEKNVGQWEASVPFIFTDGVDTLTVDMPLRYIITPTPLTVKAQDAQRYVGEENPEFNIVYEGFVNEETDSVLVKKATAYTEATTDSPAGEYPILVSGAEAQNYEMNYAEGTLAVLERPFENDSTLIASITWLQTEFDYTGTAPQPTWECTLEDYEVVADTIQLNKNVGTWEENARFTFSDGDRSASVEVPYRYTILPALLTVIVNDTVRYYGEENPEFTFTYEGFVNEETEEVLTQKPVATTTATVESPVGTYSITAEGAEADNYTIEYVDGMLTVKERIGEVDEDVTDIVSANGVTMMAGENAMLTVSLTTSDTDYNGYQFNLYLPEGISVATGEDDHYLVTEKTGRDMVALGVSDGSVLFYTTADKSHDALVSGPLMEIELTADSVLDAGVYTLRIERVVCATRENKSVSLPSSTVDVTVEKEAEPEVPAIVTAEDVEGLPAGAITLPVFLNNPTDINAFYFDLTLPKGITVADDENGKIMASLVGDYAEGKMLLTVQPWDASMGTTNNVNTWRFIATPMGESVFLANAGHVLNVTLRVDEDMASGVYTARMNVVNLVEANGSAAESRADGGRRFQALRSPAAASWTSYSSITIKTAMKGDVNGDFVVDVADIASVISVMAANGTLGSVPHYADVNGDGTVDVADIATIISEMAARARAQKLEE